MYIKTNRLGKEFSQHLVLLGSDALGSLTDLSALGGSHSDNSLMDGSLNAVMHLNIQLREGVVLIHGSITDITKGGSINHVSTRTR
jgi:hypothetical protein